VNGLVTAAALNPIGNVAALLGYNTSNAATFLWLLADFGGGTRYLAGNKRRLELPNAFLVGQAEGLCFVSRLRVFISNEHLSNPFATLPPRLYALNTGGWLPANTVLAARAKAGTLRFTAVPNPAQHKLHVERPTHEAASLTLHDLLGRTVLTVALLSGQHALDLDLTPLRAGQYLLRLQSAQGVATQQVLMQ
jgi:hypothetical protein